MLKKRIRVLTVGSGVRQVEERIRGSTVGSGVRQVEERIRGSTVGSGVMVNDALQDELYMIMEEVTNPPREIHSTVFSELHALSN